MKIGLSLIYRKCQQSSFFAFPISLSRCKTLHFFPVIIPSALPMAVKVCHRNRMFRSATRFRRSGVASKGVSQYPTAKTVFCDLCRTADLSEFLKKDEARKERECRGTVSCYVISGYLVSLHLMLSPTDTKERGV
ncbi:hypothetical protein OUZ56_013977 [Daphnia magna]|uniref:Uncharacterized protein n=1 Tax=Daphnia magna TaxID=35525 RepID=A0ABQ9Z7H9_9CRUS|nr:hypothetical protein OUZ56_013977 [Daphnia magna]